MSKIRCYGLLFDDNIQKELATWKFLGGRKIQDLAKELVANKMVKKYIIRPHNIVRFLVVGYNREYPVLDDFCGCKDFQTNLTKSENY